MKQNECKTWIEISKQNLLHNVDIFRHLVGGKVLLGGVVKANAYGHDSKLVAQIIARKVDFLAVDSIDEAIELKQFHKRILILGYTLKSRLADVVKNRFYQTVSNIETLKALEKIGAARRRPVNINLKIETGTARQGIMMTELPKYLSFIKKSHFLDLAGISTHYANIEDTTDRSFADKQLAIFNSADKLLQKNGFRDYLRHTACTAATILFPETYYDLVRVGLGLYGMWPSKETLLSSRHGKGIIDLKPVLTWKTRVSQIKVVPAGAPIGYGCTERLAVKTKLAIIPIGYYDGLKRSLSSIGSVLVRGQKCRIIGRICMNMTIIDVGHLKNVKLEDEVVVIGAQGKESISADELARKMATINYEVTTNLPVHIPRFLV